MPKLRVALNGTDTNPFHKFGLKRNPFPQLGKAETTAAEMQLNLLAADPIPHSWAEVYIRRTLEDYFSKEFIDLCVSQFVPGEYARFEVRFPKDDA